MHFRVFLSYDSLKQQIDEQVSTDPAVLRAYRLHDLLYASAASHEPVLRQADDATVEAMTAAEEIALTAARKYYQRIYIIIPSALVVSVFGVGFALFSRLRR